MIKFLPFAVLGRMILRVALPITLLSPALASAHGGVECGRAEHAIRRVQQLPDVHERRPYDVISYDLSLDWRRPIIERGPVYSGVQEMRIKVTLTTSVIEIDASLIRMDSAWIDGARFDIAAMPVNDRFRFVFQDPLVTGHEFTLKMAFTRFVKANQGVFFYPKRFYVGPDAVGDSVFVEEDLIYTQSEPLDAQFWMPCMNLPYDKAESVIRIRVPEGFVGISNGLLESTNSHTDGSKTFNWRSDKPIASYLMVANASKFVEWDEYYLRPSDPTDSVRSIYYAWPQDYDNTATDGSEYNPRHAFRNTTRILSEFSKVFGEYPFEQYGQVPVQPYNYGGMEHQGMTTVNRRWLRGFDESGIAHEIGHQWFGDKVTCETWDDLWLNEGFASYTEAIWAEINTGYVPYLMTIQGAAAWYFQYGLPTASIFGPPALEAFGQQYAPLIYGKANAVIHLLRRLVNDDTLFFNAIRDYTDAFAYGHITTAKFEQYMSQRLGIDLTQFFAQWIYGAGTPHYSIGWNQTGDQFMLRIDQQQAENVFHAPLRFFLIGQGGSQDTLIVNNTERVQYFNSTTLKTVLDVVLDPDYAVLSTSDIERDLTLADVADASSATIEFAVRGNELIVTSTAAMRGTISIVDVLGRPVSTEQINSQQTTSISLRALTPGSYFVTLATDHGRETYRFNK